MPSRRADGADWMAESVGPCGWLLQLRFGDGGAEHTCESKAGDDCQVYGVGFYDQRRYSVKEYIHASNDYESRDSRSVYFLRASAFLSIES